MAKNVLQLLQAEKQLELNWGYGSETYKISPIELLKRKRK